MRRWPVTTVAVLGCVVSLGVLTMKGPPVVIVAEQEVQVESEAPAPTFEPRAAESGPGPYVVRGSKAAEADAWGALMGAEIGESYGVGGLGLVGTGRGGGGTGDGTIGLGSLGTRGKGGGRGRYDASLQSGTLTVGTVDDNADPSGYKKALTKLAAERSALGMPEDIWQLAPNKLRHDPRPGGLDVALVIDTTGSMGDELEYLKVELRGIAQTIAKEFPDVEQRWGLVVYRDQGDDYVTLRSDFRGIEGFITALGSHTAGGGGDTPEAMHAALEESSALAWRSDDATARVVFVVADAPTHPGEEARRFAGAVKQHRAAGTAIYPVAASGVDPQAEAQLRVAAHATGGQYIFLTDHSGVGDHHAAPKVDQFKVETLETAMKRMIRLELGSAKGGPRSKPGQPPPSRDTVIPVPAPVMDEPAIDYVPHPVWERSVVWQPEPVALTAAEAPRLSLWEEVQERIAAHLLFVTSVALMLFAAMGVDSLLARRRRMVQRDRLRRG